ncbi:hypothetical protein B0T25DRAFT_589681 [Lasiosphaeria hispida]|uniref:Cell wall anchored protein n=1 Tax=Lasiosphaeria hispida TaxID=260671 RepID=A0AAJ0HM16_9PEZI|nr:hypothetical protein B0T25DRAFT_589681 [Lasiosphaeria hispida]
MVWISYGLIPLALFVGGSAAQLDPVKNFCRRFGHQTAVIDKKLYIDGGFINYNPLSQYPANFTSTGLVYQDLDVTGSGGMPQLYANLTKNNTIPSVNGGTLWVDDINKRFYLFGGEYAQNPPAPFFTLWSFDTIYKEWVSFGTPGHPAISGISYGAGASVSERGEGYYYGGWMSNNSILGWPGPPIASSNMIKYDMATNSFFNITGPDLVRRAGGSMVFIPIGDGGMLVYFGGVQDLYSNGTITGQPMEQIFLFDVLSSKWYTQNATGNVPPMRRRFCAGATWARDQSSYNIYLYGGSGMPPETAGFDDVYILSIPSFQWIKMYPDRDGTGQYPHHSLSCNVIDGAQLIIIGGTFPLTDECDVPDQFGSHNLDMGQQNPDKASWKLFRSNLTSYAVPGLIISAVGGGAAGGATKTAPATGFSNPDLQVLMTRKANIAVRTPTRSIATATNTSGAGTGTQLSHGAIAGIVVGAGSVLIAALIGCFWLIRRHRRRSKEAEPNTTSGTAGGGGGETASGAGVRAMSTFSGPWSRRSTANTTSYTPSRNSSLPVSPFQRQPSSAFRGPPVELEAQPPPGSNVWHPPDGLTYELVNTRHAVSPSLYGGSSGSGSGEPHTKIDSEGRLWVRVPSPVVGHTSTGSGSGAGLGLGISPVREGGYARYSGYSHSPVLPVSPGTPMIPQEPQELSTIPLHELSTEPERGDTPSVVISNPGDTGTHQTYYHR